MVSLLTLVQSVILGILQGLTEWLPVSSSGHLVLAQRILGVNVPVAYDVLLHIGTLLPVIFIFRKDLFEIIKSFARFDRKKKSFNFGVMIIIASIVTGVIGFSFLKFFESLFTNITAVGIGFMVTGLFLLASKFFHGNRGIGLKDAVIIGLAQGVSIAPGISRSGMTISAGLIRKIDKKMIFTFSFLLSIIAVLGAQAVEMKSLDLVDIGSVTNLLVGVIAAAFTGYAAIRVLLKILISDKFYVFAFYCFAVGLVAMIL